VQPPLLLVQREQSGYVKRLSTGRMLIPSFVLAAVVDLELETIKPLNKNPTPRINRSKLQTWIRSLSQKDSIISIE